MAPNAAPVGECDAHGGKHRHSHAVFAQGPGLDVQRAGKQQETEHAVQQYGAKIDVLDKALGLSCETETRLFEQYQRQRWRDGENRYS